MLGDKPMTLDNIEFLETYPCMILEGMEKKT